MKKMSIRNSLMIIGIVMVAIAVGFVSTVAPASAASKKTLKLIKGEGITYYKSGLVKRIFTEDADYENSSETIFKYDKAGRLISAVYHLNGEVEFSYRYDLKYNKKGKLKSVAYDDGEKSYQYKVKIGKKKGTTTYKWLSDNGPEYVLKYDSKGRIKYVKYYSYDSPGLPLYTQTNKIKWNSKGFMKRIDINDSEGGDFSYITFRTKVKSGLAKKITAKFDGEDNDSKTYTFKYAKKKIKKKYVKAVKAQQKNLLYRDLSSYYVSMYDFVLLMKV